MFLAITFALASHNLVFECLWKIHVELTVTDEVHLAVFPMPTTHFSLLRSFLTEKTQLMLK